MYSEEFDATPGLGFAIAEIDVVTVVVVVYLTKWISSRRRGDRASPALAGLRRSNCWCGWTSVWDKIGKKRVEEVENISYQNLSAGYSSAGS